MFRAFWSHPSERYHANGPVTHDELDGSADKITTRRDFLHSVRPVESREPSTAAGSAHKGKARASLGVGQALPHFTLQAQAKQGKALSWNRFEPSLPFLSTSCCPFSLSFLFVCAGAGLVARGGRCARLEGSEGGKVTCLSFPGEGEMFLFWVRRCTMRERTTAGFF